MKGLTEGRVVRYTTLAGALVVGTIVNSAPQIQVREPTPDDPGLEQADEGVVNLVVFHDRAVETTEYAAAVPYDEGGAPGTWCWPTRVE